MRGRLVVLGLYLLFLLLPIYWLVNMSLKTNEEILGSLTLWPQQLDARPTIPKHLHRSDLVLAATSTRCIYVVINTVDLARASRCRRPMPSRATASSATSICSSGC